MSRYQKIYTAIDLFCGAGGMTQGFHQAGFKCVAANDFEESAGLTFKKAFPDTTFLPGPIQDLKCSDFLEAGQFKRGDLDVLVGGPPCQAYSVYNHQRGMHDERSGLFREYIRIVAGLMPKFLVIENVTGIKSVGKGKAVEEIHTQLAKLGYHVEHKVLKSEEYGVPQERRRVFFIGSRDNNKIDWPVPTHFNHHREDNLLSQTIPLLNAVSVWDAIGDLPNLKLGEGEESMSYPTKPFTSYQRSIRKGSRKVYNHVSSSLQEINIKRMKHIPQGGSWRDIPHQLLPAGMKKARRSDHTKRYGRLEPSGLSSTILTKCDLHWGAYIHPNEDRTLTVREAARLQSFPDKMRFTGSRGEQFRQVGNAVPPILAQAVAKSLRKSIKNTDVHRGLELAIS